MMKRIATSCFLVALMFGCSSQKSTGAGGGGGGGGGGTSKVVSGVSVELAAVTLADQCGGNNMPPPVVIKTADTNAKSPPAEEAVAAMEPKKAAPDQAPAAPAARAMCQPGQDCGGGGHRQACEQTSMQLSFTSSEAQPSKIEVKKIELLDDSGKLIAELTTTSAMKWTGSKYEGWDQMVPAKDSIAASFALSSPPYDKMGGRYESHNKKFQLRVTVTVGGKDQTVEKKAIAPTMLEPAVPT